MRRCVRRLAGALTAAPLLLAGCGGEDPEAPPEIVYGSSVCADCDMIISDERFASATMAADERGGARALLFDDIGDQILYESERPELKILARWVHDHDTAEWMRAEEAIYVRSPDLHTPMGTGIAAFATRQGAEAMVERVGGEVLDFEALWSAEPAGPGDG